MIAWTLVSSPAHNHPLHPENCGRLAGLPDWQNDPGDLPLLWQAPQPAHPQELLPVHSARYLAALEQAAQRGPAVIDEAPTYVTRGSYQAALLAAGATLAVTRAVVRGAARRGFAVIRPPGHHAGLHAPSGFCLVNNAAVAAAGALREGVERALIVDLDAHHGNGTQEIFAAQDQVGFLSIHQRGLYPFSGAVEDLPHARRRIANLPVAPYTGDKGYARLVEEVAVPMAQQYQPGVIFCSLGFDAHWKDPLSQLGLSISGIVGLVTRLAALADDLCEGRLVVVLEGGYQPGVLAAGIEATLRALAGRSPGRDPYGHSPAPEPDNDPLIRAARRRLGLSEGG